MTSAPRADNDPTRGVIDLITGGWRAQALYAAVKFKLAEHIMSGHTTSSELAKSTGAKADGIHRLMRLLVSIGVFDGNERTGYSNTAMSRTLLEGPQSLSDMCLLYGEECYAAWGHAHHAINTESSGFEAAFGTSFYKYLGQNKAVAERFQHVMNAGNMFFHDIANVFDFSGAKTVVDVGGGGGELLTAVLAATPDANGIYFDREHMVAEARRHIETTVGLDRVAFVGGDMFEGVPAGGDVYLFSRVFAGWQDSAIIQVLQDCRSRMRNSASRVIILDRLVREEGSSMLSALWDLQLLMTIGGRHRSLENFTAILNTAGFSVERVAMLPTETTAIIAAPKAEALLH
jgi:O-methyltransferase domain/Dimerisation domain